MSTNGSGEIVRRNALETEIQYVFTFSGIFTLCVCVSIRIQIGFVICSLRKRIFHFSAAIRDFQFVVFSRTHFARVSVVFFSGHFQLILSVLLLLTVNFCFAI